MIHSILLAVTQDTPTELSFWQGTPVMIASCLLVLFIAGRTIEEPHTGPKMPLPFPSLFNNPSVGTFLGSMSFGHLLGVLAILGLAPYLQ